MFCHTVSWIVLLLTTLKFIYLLKFLMAKRPSWIGQTLNNRYKIEKLLGQGGMSAVFKANDPNLRRNVAIKLIHSHLASDEQFVRRFEEEAAAVAQLRHPNIIQVHDFNHDDDDVYYMVLEFLAGETLGERQDRLIALGQKLSLEETIPFMMKLLSAVHYAHNQGMVHRDLKPANVMIRDTGEPVLMDFGIVKMMENVGHTASGVIMGTMAYMAPEQIRGEKIDHRIDIYALGVILFEILIGQKPFDGESTVTTMMKHLNESPPDLVELDPGIPHDLAEIVYKAMEKDPAARYQSAAEMGHALYQAGESLGIAVSNDMGGTFFGSALPSDATEVYQPLNTAFGESLPTVPHQRAQRKAPDASGTEKEPADQKSMLATLFANNWAIAAIVVVALMAIAAVTLGLRQLESDGDDDGDGLTNAQELELGTDPRNPDSDRDGMTDLNENSVSCLNPLVPDTDQDGILDGSDADPCEGVPSAPTNRIFARIVSIEIEEMEAIGTSGGSAYGSNSTYGEPETADAAAIDDVETPVVVMEERYVVTFETDGFSPAPQQTHVHFYYNTVAENDSGLPEGKGPWEVHAKPDPFTRFRVVDRPLDATEICIIAASGDHHFIENTGECLLIPTAPSQ